MSHLIRRATIDDVIQISNLYVTSLKNTFNGIFSEGYLSKMTPASKYQQWKRNIENPNNIVLVLEHDQEIVGMIVGAFVSEGGETSNQGNILAVYINPDYKRMGYGKNLVTALFDEFKKRNITKCVANVFKNNHNKGFFERVGGVLVDERPVDEAHVISIFVYSWDKI
ncbi:MAG: GNAT family N-acetyltransferase [Lysinibacillus sp.]